jgi:hypothetical protein
LYCYLHLPDQRTQRDSNNTRRDASRASRRFATLPQRPASMRLQANNRDRYTDERRTAGGGSDATAASGIKYSVMTPAAPPVPITKMDAGEARRWQANAVGSMSAARQESCAGGMLCSGASPAAAIGGANC